MWYSCCICGDRSVLSMDKKSVDPLRHHTKQEVENWIKRHTPYLKPIERKEEEKPYTDPHIAYSFESPEGRVEEHFLDGTVRIYYLTECPENLELKREMQEGADWSRIKDVNGKEFAAMGNGLIRDIDTFRVVGSL